MRKSFGFTLAEVLITLGIIGVVAAMTLPTLIAKHKEKAVVTKLKAVNSIFSQAFTMSVLEYGTPDNWGLSNLDMREPTDTNPLEYDTENNRNSSTIMFNNISKYLNNIKICSSNNKKECFDIGIDNWANVPSGVLANGVSYYFFARSGNCTEDNGNSPQLRNVCGDLTVDLGLSKNKQWGRDIFRFKVTKYGIVPNGLPNATQYNFENTCIPTEHDGCAAWAIMNENLDYLRCRDDLSWDGNTKCK